MHVAQGNSASDGQKYRAFWAPKIGLSAIEVTRLATAVSSRKTPKMAINRDFPPKRAVLLLRFLLFSNMLLKMHVAPGNSHPMVKSTILECLKSSYENFSHPAVATPGAEKHPKWP